jgi:cytoskeletal protein CcmA (bactofilin family)
VRANSVTIGGEVEGNIESAASVEMLSTGVLTGDLKAGTLTVASGSRMRGKVEFGWGDEHPAKSTLTLGSRQAS